MPDMALIWKQIYSILFYIIYIQKKYELNLIEVWTFSYSRLISLGEGMIVIKRSVKSTISFKMGCKLKHFSLQRAGVNNTKKFKNLISVTDPPYLLKSL